MAYQVELTEQEQALPPDPTAFENGSTPARNGLPAALKSGKTKLSPNQARTRNVLEFGAALAVLGGALAFWGLSLPQIDYRSISDYGLIASLPVSFFAALGLLTAGFGLLLRRAKPPGLLLLLYVVALIFIIHGTTALVYETPRYYWTYKHIGVTAYIQANGSVNPSIDIYHNWPGFFALSAFFTDLAGLGSALDYAAWAQVFFNLLYLGPLLVIFKSLSQNWRLVWLSAWFFYITSWPGQDYFSPQALAYFFHLAFLAVLLTYFRAKEPPSLAVVKRWLPVKPLAARFHKLLGWAWPDASREENLRPGQEFTLKVILILIFGAIVATHQLTPYITLVEVIVLVLFQFCKLRRLPVLMAVMMAGWLFYMAEPFIESKGLVFKHQFLKFFANLDSNIVDISNATPGHAFVSLVARGMTVILLLLASGGIMQRLRHGRRDLMLVLLVAAPAPMFVLQDYGGEMIYRIYLFSLPWLVFLAAAVFFPAENRPVSWKVTAFSLLTGLVLLAGFTTVYYGNEKANNYSPDELAAARYLYRTAPAGSILIKLNFNFPYKFVSNYNRYVEFAMVNDPNVVHQGFVINDIVDVVDLITRFNYPAGYVVFSRSQRAYVGMSGVVSPAWADQLEAQIQRSGRFQLVYSNRDTEIFRMVKEAAPG